MLNAEGRIGLSPGLHRTYTDWEAADGCVLARCIYLARFHILAAEVSSVVRQPSSCTSLHSGPTFRNGYRFFPVQRASLPGRMVSPALAACIVTGIPSPRSVRLPSSGRCVVVMACCGWFTVSLTVSRADISHITACYECYLFNVCLVGLTDR